MKMLSPKKKKEAKKRKRHNIKDLLKNTRKPLILLGFRQKSLSTFSLYKYIYCEVLLKQNRSKPLILLGLWAFF